MDSMDSELLGKQPIRQRSIGLNSSLVRAQTIAIVAATQGSPGMMAVKQWSSKMD